MVRRSSMLARGVPVLGLILPALVVLVMAAADASAARRVALVIGNGEYAEAPDLPNPPNDARDVGAALERLGFEVQVTLDADIDEMRAALRSFTERLPGADTALFYYAGHGLQYAGDNYLIPTNAALEQEADLHFEALSLDLVMNLVQDPERTTLVFLDACRDNPLARSFARSLGATRSTQVGRGLARVEGGIGSLIAFATAPGDVALDGTGDNSPFTRALLEYIDRPGLEVRQMLSRVRDAVYRETDGEQLPWDNSSLRGDFYFNPEPESEPEPAAAPEQTAATAPAGEESAGRTTSAAELAFWQAIENSRSPREYELFLEKFPDSPFADLARTRLAALQEEAAPADDPEPTAAAPAPEVAPEPEPAPEEPEPEPVPEEPDIAIDPLEAEQVVVRDANFRARPGVDGERLGTLPAGTRVRVLGSVRGADWYQIERPGGAGVAYIYAPLVDDAVGQEAEPETEVAAVSPGPDPSAPTADEAPAEPERKRDQVSEEPEAGEEEQADTATETAALVAPSEPPAEVDAQALGARLLDEWRRGRFKYEDPMDGRCKERATVTGWSELPPEEAVVGLAGGTSDRKVFARRHSSFKTDADLVAVVEPDLIALIEYKHLKANTSGGWCQRMVLESGLFNALIQRSPYLAAQGAGVGAMERHSVGGWTGIELIYALTEITSDEGARPCVAFMGSRRRDRIDGFACAAPGGSFGKADAERFLERIRIDGVLG